VISFPWLGGKSAGGGRGYAVVIMVRKMRKDRVDGDSTTWG